MQTDKGFRYADVISFNLYPWWYNGPADQVVAAWQAKADWVESNWPTKPFIISETGAGGIDGNRSSNLSRWSEEYQSLGERKRSSSEPSHSDAAVPSHYFAHLTCSTPHWPVDGFDVGVAMNSSKIAGIALWQFTDIKVDALNSSTNRPGGINNKGVLDRFRRPKLSALRVASIFAGGA